MSLYLLTMVHLWTTATNDITFVTQRHICSCTLDCEQINWFSFSQSVTCNIYPILTPTRSSRMTVVPSLPHAAPGWKVSPIPTILSRTAPTRSLILRMTVVPSATLLPHTASRTPLKKPNSPSCQSYVTHPWTPCSILCFCWFIVKSLLCHAVIHITYLYRSSSWQIVSEMYTLQGCSHKFTCCYNFNFRFTLVCYV